MVRKAAVVSILFGNFSPVILLASWKAFRESLECLQHVFDYAHICIYTGTAQSLFGN